MRKELISRISCFLFLLTFFLTPSMVFAVPFTDEGDDKDGVISSLEFRPHTFFGRRTLGKQDLYSADLTLPEKIILPPFRVYAVECINLVYDTPSFLLPRTPQIRAPPASFAISELS